MKYKLIIISLIFLLFGCTNSIDETVYSVIGNTMGTTYSVKFTSKNPINNNEIKFEIDTLLKEVNRQMSTYIPSSELSLFNKSTDTTWFNVSKDLAVVFDKALLISKISNGKFDITVGPLVNLWGFGTNNVPQIIPSDSEIAKKKKNIGYDKIAVRLSPPAIKKSNPNIYCDLSAIAKGFGVDKIAEFLSSKGITNYLVEIGGELRANGKKFGNEWKVGISVPNQSQSIQEIIYLDNQAMATSGDYWNYFEKDGVRYSHTIDPLTGKPITHKLASVTVVAKSCMEADAMATAIDVMGPKFGFEFAKENELNVYFIVKGKKDFKIFYTPQFKNLIVKGN